MGDEAVLGAIDTFVAQQGANMEVAKDLKNDIFCEAGQRISLAGGAPPFRRACDG